MLASARSRLDLNCFTSSLSYSRALLISSAALSMRALRMAERGMETCSEMEERGGLSLSAAEQDIGHNSRHKDTIESTTTWAQLTRDMHQHTYITYILSKFSTRPEICFQSISLFMHSVSFLSACLDFHPASLLWLSSFIYMHCSSPFIHVSASNDSYDHSFVHNFLQIFNFNSSHQSQTFVMNTFPSWYFYNLIDLELSKLEM